MIEQTERIDEFLEELERSLPDGGRTSNGFSPAERQALDLAARLALADFSPDSQVRESLRLGLARQAAARLPETIAAPFEHPARQEPSRRLPLLQSVRPLGWIGLVAVLMLVLGLAFHSLGPQPGLATPALTRTLFTPPASPALVSTLAETLSPARTATPAEAATLASLPIQIRPAAYPVGAQPNLPQPVAAISLPSLQTPSAVPIPAAR